MVLSIPSYKIRKKAQLDNCLGSASGFSPQNFLLWLCLLPCCPCAGSHQAVLVGQRLCSARSQFLALKWDLEPGAGPGLDIQGSELRTSLPSMWKHQLLSMFWLSPSWRPRSLCEAARHLQGDAPKDHSFVSRCHWLALKKREFLLLMSGLSIFLFFRDMVSLCSLGNPGLTWYVD